MEKKQIVDGGGWDGKRALAELSPQLSKLIVFLRRRGVCPEVTAAMRDTVTELVMASIAIGWQWRESVD